MCSTMWSTCFNKRLKQLNMYINQGNGGTPISRTSAHESTAVAAPKSKQLQFISP